MFRHIFPSFRKRPNSVEKKLQRLGHQEIIDVAFDVVSIIELCIGEKRLKSPKKNTKPDSQWKQRRVSTLNVAQVKSPVLTFSHSVF